VNEAAESIFDLLPKNGLKLSGSQIKATLGLEDEEYKVAKAELKEAGLVVLGRGRSGTISVAEIDPDAPDAMPEIAKIGKNASAALWENVLERKEFHNCYCELSPNMTYEELVELEEGCKGSRQRAKRLGIELRAGRNNGWVCEVLDFYRHSMFKYRDKREENFDNEIELETIE
jgi:hypothetical protein